MNKTAILHMRNLKADLTDKQIADNIRGLLHPRLLVDICVVDESSVATARQAGAQDAYEQACKAMCGHCRRAVAVECLPVHGWVHFVNDGLQPRGEAGRYADCQAAGIRALAAAEAGKEGE